MANILNIDKVEPTDIEIESSIHYKLNRCRYHKVIRLVQQTKYKNNCDRMCGIGENKMFEKKYIFIYLQIKNIGFLMDTSTNMALGLINVTFLCYIVLYLDLE